MLRARRELEEVDEGLDLGSDLGADAVTWIRSKLASMVAEVDRTEAIAKATAFSST